MNNWFLCKVKYKKEDEKGMLKNMSEQYLVDALSFTEAEARIYEELSSVIRGEFLISNLSKSRLVDVFEYEDGEYWYKCKTTYVSADDDSGKERKVTNYMLVSASDVKEAYARIEENLTGMLVPYRIPEVVETPIMEIFRFKSSEARENEIPSNLKPISDL